MLDEITAAVLFLVRLIERSENFNRSQLEEFKRCLSDLLAERFQDHWFPEQPFKGQGYRCIRVNERDRRDETIERAARACGLNYEDLQLPVELTLWVDPNEVCCRFGEHRGSYCTLASFNDKENVSPIKTPVKESKSKMIPLSSNNGRHVSVPSLSPSSTSSTKSSSSSASIPSLTNSSPSAPPAHPVIATSSGPSPGNVSGYGNGSGGGNNNNSNSNGRKGSGPRKHWNSTNHGLGFHQPYWYNMVPPHWLPASPPPYHPHHPLLRTSPQASKWAGRYHHWQTNAKTALKV